MSRLISNTFKLASGSVLAQLISIGTMPVITRLYSPSELGIFSAFIALLSICAPLSTLRFNETIILPENHFDAYILFCLSEISVSIFSFIVMLLIASYMFLLPNTQFIGFQDTQNTILWLLPLAIFFRGSILGVNTFAIRQGLFSNLAVENVLMTLANRFCVIIEGLFTKLGSWGLIIGRLVGAFVGIMYILKSIQKQLRPLVASQQVTLHDIKQLFYKYRQFPIYGTWSVLLDTTSKELPVLLLTILFSAKITGYYSLGVSIVYLPMTIVGYSLNRSLLRHAVSLKNKHEQLVHEIREIVVLLLFCSLPFILLLSFLGDFIFTFAFGHRWYEAGVYIRILSPAFLFVFLYIPLRSLFIVFERTRERLFFDLTNFFIKIVSMLVVGILTKSPLATLSILSITTCIFVSLFFIYIAYIASAPPLFFIKAIGYKMLLMTPLALGLIMIRELAYFNNMLAFSLAFIMICIQGLFLFYSDMTLRNMLRRR